MKKKSPNIRLIGMVLRQYPWRIALVAVFIVLFTVANLTSTLFTRSLIDDYITPLLTQAVPDYAPLARALVLLAVVLAVGTALGYSYTRIMVVVDQRFMLGLRSLMFDHMQRLPLKYFDSRAHGDIMSTYTNDVDSADLVVGETLPDLIHSSISIIAVLTSMVVLSPHLTVVSLFVAGLMIVASRALGNRSRAHYKAVQQTTAQAEAFVQEMMQGQKVVKVFSHEEESTSRFDELNEQLRDSTFNANRLANIVMPVNGNLGQLGYVLIATVGALLALSGNADITLGTIVAFLTLNRNFTQPVTQISQQVNSIVQASAGAERIFALVDEEEETDNGTVTVEGRHWVKADGTRTPVEGGVVFSDVSFGYEPGQTVLHHLSLEAAPDQRLAFVGGTGAGKTTILNLITRFYDPQEGSITIDGIPLADIRKGALRQCLGMVPQETRLFSGTVMENLRYGRLDASDDECMRVAREVGADTFIRRMPQGYETTLDAAGGSLSQGERQLLAAARAAIAGSPVLVLDEATSNIDTRTELLVQQGLERLMEGRTTFVIAHRLSTVREADKIVVLEHGRIVEQGSHQELLALGGRYKSLYANSVL